MSDAVTAVPDYRVKSLTRLVESNGFNFAIASVIVANAVVLGAQTYPNLSPGVESTLTLLDTTFYAVFVAELITRIASYGRRPWMFFTNGWNIFDFIIIGGALIPAVREHATVLRLFRLARLARIIRVLPGARMLIRTVTRALPAVGSMVLATVVLLFMYAMIGWWLFGAAIPEDWGTVGTAMVTLFVMLTLENLPDKLAQAQDVSVWANLYFMTYVLVAAFVIVNLFIGIVVSAMDEVQAEEEAERERSDSDDLHAKLDRMQRTLDDLRLVNEPRRDDSV
ncbi:MAG: ion transporter [Actinobacteria bacterium]|nr:ion transporter [Actinomycetota bacterium]MCB9413040.1 ion transporter [Actinomycetota bacterium]